MEVVASWTKALCVEISQGRIPNDVDAVKAEASELDDKLLSSWSVLDIGTGNGLLLQELAKQGYGFMFGHILVTTILIYVCVNKWKYIFLNNHKDHCLSL